ncbi:MAG: C25 family cysteine peptidase, partial [Ferruginibacter sp.]
MKKLLLPVLLLSAFVTQGQLNNSWIDYNKTYYKFRIESDTLINIPQPVLAAAGLSNVPASQFQLWRNGSEVRMYTSVSTGILGASDFLEFRGEMNDGKPDKQLYKDPSFQLSDRYSLETDTVSYFLTVNPTGNNLRYTNAVNNPPGTLSPEPYFMKSTDVHYKVRLNRGFAIPLGEYIYSSAYDKGEGWTTNDINAGSPYDQIFSNLQVYTAGPSNGLSIRVNAAGSAPNSRNLSIKINGTAFPGGTVGMPFFEVARINITGLPLSLLSNPNDATVSVANINVPVFDRFVIGSIGITYPALFNFKNQKSFSFDIQPSATAKYLVIDNFNHGSMAPALYDNTTGARYLGDISTPGKVKFVLPPSGSTRNFFLVNQEPGNKLNIVSLSQKNFVNYSATTLQGDYAIISHPALYNDGNGNNLVDQYRLYRNSIAGGSFNTKVYNIDELVDQFAFGIKRHPGSVRDFIRYADVNFSVKPKYVFLIGRGLSYQEHRPNESNPIINKLDFIPTFGWPASDILLAAQPGTVTPIVPIGRLSVVNGQEIKYYLDKLKQYDQAQQTPGSTIAAKAWMKNFMHVAGGRDSSESDQFIKFMNNYKRIAEDTLYGAYVESFSKTSSGAVQQANSQRIEQLFQEGLGLISYFGHSSATTFEFNLSNPELYNNQGKYPFFNVSGCSAGNFYIFDPLRLTGNLTLSEKYVLTPQHGSIGFLADTHFGLPTYLDNYNISFYNKFSKTLYSNTVGNQLQSVAIELGGNNPNLDFFTRIHLEQITLHGDPAVKINAFPKADYVIEDQLVKISPNIISVADNNFKVQIKMQNIGKAVGDSIWVLVKRKLPNDTVRTLYNKLIPGIKYADSINLVVPVNPLTDKGLNQLIITLDYTNKVDELFETNNTITKDFYVFDDELRPVYPYNYSIINQQNLTYTASTANPLSGMRNYIMEIDTTELFNSPIKKISNTNGVGGIVQFSPAITFIDSTVYYWRVAMTPLNGGPFTWNNSSFIYLATGSPGFNQSHYFQFQNNTNNNVILGNDRVFKYAPKSNQVGVKTGIYPFSGETTDFALLRDGNFLQAGFYAPFSANTQVLRFYVVDNKTNRPLQNIDLGSSGLYGSLRPVPINNTVLPGFFHFKMTTVAERQIIMNFLDIVPTGYYVILTNSPASPTDYFPADWRADTTVLGSGNSLYHKLKANGLTQLDSVKNFVPFIFVYKKGSGVALNQTIGRLISDKLDITFEAEGVSLSGDITSDRLGPARQWNSLHFRGRSLESPSTDSYAVQVIGIDNNGAQTLLATVSPAVDTSLSWIDARTYPYLKLKLLTADSLNATPYQLKYWLINASYL